MTQTWRDSELTHLGRTFDFRAFEDLQGGVEPPIFVVQPMDNQPFSSVDALSLKSSLEQSNNLEQGSTRIWELTPDGNFFEHSHAPGNEVDGMYGAQFLRTPIAPEVAQETLGNQVHSYEQQHQMDFMELQAPEVSYD